jgi:hypothetical protein
MKHHTRSSLRALAALALTGPFATPGTAANGPWSSIASRGLWSDGLSGVGGTVAGASGLSAVTEIEVFHSRQAASARTGCFFLIGRWHYIVRVTFFLIGA